MILDTSAVPAFVDGDAGGGAVLGRPSRAAIPVMVPGEFRYGIAQSRHRADYEAWLVAQFPHIDILAVTDETAMSAAQAFPGETTPFRYTPRAFLDC